MRRKWIGVLALVTIAALSLSFAVWPGGGASADPLLKKIAKGQIKPAVIQTGSVTRTAPVLSSGVISAAQDELRQEESDLASGAGGSLSIAGGGTAPGSLGCSKRDSSGNTRVNQDCSFRRQAEESITFNPVDPNNLVAGQNDSRVGFNQCGIDFSTDNGKHWGDLLPPFRQKLNYPAFEEPTATDPNRHTIEGGDGTAHTYDAASDPAVAFDSQGGAYFSCVAFDVYSNASLVYVVASPQGAQGSFFFNIDSFGRSYVVAEDNSPLVFHDKEFIAADSYASSPNRDNVYVTWTTFRFDADGNFQRAPIYGSMSTDHAQTWSTPEEISGTSDTLCFFGNYFDPSQPEHACNFDQGSDPRVLPNGDLFVVFNNGNTPATDPNAQQLGVLCHPSGSSPEGTAHLNCASPSKVGDDVSVGEPQCDFGRGPEECVPGPYIRTNDFPRLAVNPQNGHLSATWQDYRNGEYDIQLANSVDGGQTWTPSVTVNPDTGLDHYFPAVDFAKLPNSDRVGVSYYRSERVPDENQTPEAGFAPGTNAGVQEGMSDYVLAGATLPQAPFAYKVLSPVFGPPDGVQQGFNGDYSGLTINKSSDAHPIWSDTRNANPYPQNGVTHDEDVFSDNVGLPNGNAKPQVGVIGR